MQAERDTYQCIPSVRLEGHVQEWLSELLNLIGEMEQAILFEEKSRSFGILYSTSGMFQSFRRSTFANLHMENAYQSFFPGINNELGQHIILYVASEARYKYWLV